MAGCSAAARSLKIEFVKPLNPNAQALLSRPALKPAYCIGQEVQKAGSVRNRFSVYIIDFLLDNKLTLI
jgi:hypothetical protein